MSLCSAEVTIGACDTLINTVDLTTFKNVVYKSCTVSTAVVLDNIQDSAQVSFVGVTFATGGKFTLKNVGKLVTLRFYDVKASAAFLDGTVTLAGGNIYVTGLSAMGITLLPTSITLDVSGSTIPTIQTKNCKIKTIGGTLKKSSLVHYTGGDPHHWESY